MKTIQTEIEGLLIIEPKIFSDPRGFFTETYQKDRYHGIGIDNEFIQDNLSKSGQGTLRGLHYQLPPFQQSKLVQVIQGEVFDVAVDIRKNSATFGYYHSIVLSEEKKNQFYIPKGFAHGFCVLSETAIFQYKCDNLYAPEYERGILWSDPQLKIPWPIAQPILSDKDELYPLLPQIKPHDLPN